MRENDIDGEKLQRILKAHWLDPERLEQDDFRHCFVERGQAMLDLINRTMGKPTADRRQVFRDTLDSIGLVTEPDDDDTEYDPAGESTSGDNGSLGDN